MGAKEWRRSSGQRRFSKGVSIIEQLGTITWYVELSQKSEVEKMQEKYGRKITYRIWHQVISHMINWRIKAGRMDTQIC